MLEDKARASLRGSTSALSSMGQALVLKTLQNPELKAQRDDVRRELARRYHALKAALDEAGLEHWPFNSGFFALLKVAEPERVRLELLEQGYGVVALAEAGGVRLSYGSLDVADIPELVAALRKAIG